MAVIGRYLRGARLALWLGIQIESNWTDPFLFMIYSVVRPLASVLILFFMFVVLSGGQGGPMLNYFLVGSAFWPYVLNALQGLAFTVVEDREEYHMIRYIYATPLPFTVYLIGRTLAKLLIATVAVAITFIFAVTVLGLPVRPSVVNLPYLAASFLLGFVGMWALGMAVAALSMNFTQQAWTMPEAVGGALYLLCGAIFPITTLPGPLEMVGGLLPITYWLEAARRGLIGAGVSSFPSLSDEGVLLGLLLTTVCSCILGYAAFAFGERRAKTTGNLDRTSEY